MEDRNLQHKRSARRKSRIKNRKRNEFIKKLLIIGFLLAVTYGLLRVSIFLVSGYMASRKNNIDTGKQEESIQSVDKNGGQVGLENDQEGQGEDQVEKAEEPDKTDYSKQDLVNMIMADEAIKKADLDKRINDLLKDKRVSDKAKADHAIGYYNLDLNEEYLMNQDVKYAAGGANNFMLGMYIFDLAKSGGLDIESDYEGEIKYKEKKDEVVDPTRYNIKNLIKKAVADDSVARKILIDIVEKVGSGRWYDLLSAKYGIAITEYGEMSAKDLLSGLKLLFTNVEGKYTYEELIGYMENETSSTIDGSEIQRSKIYGGRQAYSYPNFLNFGYVKGQSSYVFVIISGRDDNSFNLPALRTIDSWVNYYQK